MNRNRKAVLQPFLDKQDYMENRIRRASRRLRTDGQRLPPRIPRGTDAKQCRYTRH